MKKKFFYKKKILIIVSARSDSKRLPNKALLSFPREPMILFLLKRIKMTKQVSKVILATTNRQLDDKLANQVEKHKFTVFRGDANNVLKRYIDASNVYGGDYIIRITGDCPFVNSEIIEFCLNQIEISNFDLATTKGFFPKGLDLEIYKNETLKDIYKNYTLDDSEKEHMLNYLYNNKKDFKILHLKPKAKWVSELSYTVDTKADFVNALKIFELRNKNPNIDELINFKL